MFRVTREITFCYGHRLLNYDGKCRHLHGHNGRAVITLEAPQLDALGMVVDFSRIKRVVGGWIDEALDHKMLCTATTRCCRCCASRASRSSSWTSTRPPRTSPS